MQHNTEKRFDEVALDATQFGRGAKCQSWHSPDLPLTRCIILIAAPRIR